MIMQTRSDLSFTITDDFGNKLPDIKRAFLAAVYITKYDYELGTVIYPSQKYKSSRIYSLYYNATLRNLLEKEQCVKCIVSFQQRTHGDYAIARIFEDVPSVDNRTMTHEERV
jgi:hypothetical protein